MNRLKAFAKDIQKSLYIGKHFNWVLGLKLTLCNIGKRIPTLKYQSWMKKHALISAFLMDAIGNSILLGGVKVFT